MFPGTFVLVAGLPRKLRVVERCASCTMKRRAPSGECGIRTTGQRVSNSVNFHHDHQWSVQHDFVAWIGSSSQWINATPRCRGARQEVKVPVGHHFSVKVINNGNILPGDINPLPLFPSSYLAVPAGREAKSNRTCSNLLA